MVAASFRGADCCRLPSLFALCRSRFAAILSHRMPFWCIGCFGRHGYHYPAWSQRSSSRKRCAAASAPSLMADFFPSPDFSTTRHWVLIEHSLLTSIRQWCCIIRGAQLLFRLLRRRSSCMIFVFRAMLPNKSPEPTAVGAVRSAIAVHVASRRWLSFFR